MPQPFKRAEEKWYVKVQRYRKKIFRSAPQRVCVVEAGNYGLSLQATARFCGGGGGGDGGGTCPEPFESKRIPVINVRIDLIS
jgi:hypothetical protein